MKKTKIKPVLIHSREGFQGVVSEIVAAKLSAAALQVEMEQEIAQIQKRYQGDMDEISREIQAKEAGVHVWAVQNPKEFGERRSIELTQAIVGFRTCPPAVEKIRSRDTWGDIAQRLASVNDGEFIGENYLRYKDPEVDKTSLIADRESIPERALKTIGIRIEQDEVFFIEPKSEVAGKSTREAA